MGDFIVRLKNAGMAGHRTVRTPYSKLRHAIAQKLVEAGYITSVETGSGALPTLQITLAYDKTGRTHQIRGVQRISKPGCRRYRKVKDIYPAKFGHGKYILSTPAGILTDEEARHARVGGEVLFMIW